MPAQSPTTKVIQHRALILFKRKRSNIWQCRYKIDGIWIRASTGEYDEIKATKQADNMRMEAAALKKHDLPPQTRSFKHVAQNVIRQIDDYIASGKNKIIYKDYKFIIVKYLIPILGAYKMSSINGAVMQAFDAKRQAIMGKVPAHSTVLNHNAALNMIFEYAVNKSYMAKSRVPLLKATGKKSIQRPEFNATEVAKIIYEFDNWIAEAETSKQEERKLLKDYVFILLDTGIRAGGELMNLQWQQIDYIVNTKKVGHQADEYGEQEDIHETETVIYLHVTGKGKPREARGNKRTAEALQSILSRNYSNMTLSDMVKSKCNEHVIALANKSQPKNLAKLFDNYLKKLDLLIEPKTQQRRVLYSLRHTYATLALENDEVPIHTLAKQLGNSVPMIEKHYSHLKVRESREQLSNKETTQLIQSKINQLAGLDAFNLDEEDRK